VTFAVFDATRSATVCCRETPKTPHRAPSPTPTVRRSKNDPAGLAPPSFTPSAVGTVESPLGQRTARRHWQYHPADAGRSPIPSPPWSLRLVSQRTPSACGRDRSPISLAALSDNLHFRDCIPSRTLTPSPSPGGRGEPEPRVPQRLTRTHRGRPYRPAVRRSRIPFEVRAFVELPKSKRSIAAGCSVANPRLKFEPVCAVTPAGDLSGVAPRSSHARARVCLNRSPLRLTSVSG